MKPKWNAMKALEIYMIICIILLTVMNGLRLYFYSPEGTFERVLQFFHLEENASERKSG